MSFTINLNIIRQIVNQPLLCKCFVVSLFSQIHIFDENIVVFKCTKFCTTGETCNLLKIADFLFNAKNNDHCSLEYQHYNCSSGKYLHSWKITLFKGMHQILAYSTSWNSDLTVKSFWKMCRKLYVNQRKRISCNEFSEHYIYDKIISTLMSPFYVMGDAKFSFISSGVLISLFVLQLNTKERCLFKPFDPYFADLIIC